MGYTKVCNDPQPPTATHNHLQALTITQKTTHNYPKVNQKFQNLLQLCYCTLDFNTETDVGFDSDMKQWLCIHVCVSVSVCIYFISHYIYYFLVKLIVCFCKH